MALLRAQVRVWVVPRGRLVGVGAPESRPLSPRDLQRAQERGAQVLQVASHGLFRPQCLVRSIALQQILTADQLAGATVHVGVRMTDAGFEAHAWVRIGGALVGDRDEHVRAFEELTTVEPHRGA